MGFLKIITLVFIILLLIVGIDIIIKFKRNSDKPIEEIRKSLIVRINIITVLTVILAVLSVLNIVYK